MADVPLPPFNQPVGTPPPPPTTPPPMPPAAPLPDNDEEADNADEIASNLSPFKVLGKPAPVPPPFNVPVPSLVGSTTGSVPPAVPPPTPPKPLPFTPSAPAPPVAPIPPVPLPAPPTPAPIPTPPAPVSIPVVQPFPDAKPTGGSPLDDELNENDLVAAAANAPSHPLILPNRMPGGRERENEKVKPEKDRAQFLTAEPTDLDQTLNKIPVNSRGLLSDDQGGITKTEVIPPQPLPLPGQPVPIQRPIAPSPAPPPLPKPFSQPPLKPLAKPVLGALPSIPLTSLGGHRSSPVIAVIGVVIALVLLGGGGYVLALTGVRLPVLGSLVSGLPGSAVQATSLSAGFVDAHPPYHLIGTSDITVTNEKDKTLADGTPAIYKVHVENKGGLLTDKGTRFLQSVTVAANGGTAIPLLLRDTGSEYLATFPENTDTTTASLVADNLDDTLLSPALRPLPLEAVLKAVQGEQGYQKTTINQLPAASYSVTLDPTQLKGYFPVDSTLETPVAVLALAWKGAGVTASQPLDLQISAAFTYQTRKYQFVGHWQYDSWGSSTPPSDLSTLASTDPGNIDTELTAESFVSRLGVSFKALPHGTDATSGAPVDDTTRFTPVIPSGDVIQVVQSARDINPPLPTQPASTEAKQRDAQRKQDLDDIQKAIEQYKLEKGSYPSVSAETQLASSSTLFGLLVPTYLTKMPVDPLNSTYYYVYNVVTDSSGTVTGYYLRAVLEDHTDNSATIGAVYHYYQLSNK